MEVTLLCAVLLLSVVAGNPGPVGLQLDPGEASSERGEGDLGDHEDQDTEGTGPTGDGNYTGNDRGASDGTTYIKNSTQYRQPTVTEVDASESGVQPTATMDPETHNTSTPVLDKKVSVSISPKADHQLFPDGQTLPECKKQCVLSSSTPRLFSVPEKDILLHTKKECTILPNGDNSTKCVLKIADLLKEYVNIAKEQGTFVHTLGIICPSSQHVFLTSPDKGFPSLKGAIGYLYSVMCKIYWGDMSKYGEVVDLRVLYLADYVDHFEEERKIPDSPFFAEAHDLELRTLPNGLKFINTFSHVRYFGEIPKKVPQVFLEYKWPYMAEIQFTNTYIDSIPEKLQETMPSLQSMEWHNATKLKAMPKRFPWAPDRLELPRNLSRTPTFNQHYSVPLIIQENLYRRVLKYTGCDIEGWTHPLQGMLDQIILKDGNLQYLDPQTFANATHLQHIDLSHNKLDVLSSELFKGLNHLKEIDLGYNHLQTIDPEMFQGLQSLRLINLTHNLIGHLRNGTFSMLPVLQSLDMSSNNITVIEPNVLSHESETLENLFFGDNQIYDIPLWALMLRNSRVVDFSKNRVSLDAFLRVLEALDYNHFVYKHIKSASDPESVMEPAAHLVKSFKLNNNQIHTIPMDNLTLHQTGVLRALLFFFNVDLKGNPLICDCHSYPLYLFLKYDNCSCLTLKTFYSRNWQCQSPASVRNKPIVSVPKTSFRCAMNVHRCPDQCICYNRTVDTLLQVECNDVILQDLPYYLPQNVKHLRLVNASLDTLNFVPEYLDTLELFDVSYNLITSISSELVLALTKINEVHLDHNKLYYLPNEFSEINSPEWRNSTLYLGSNPVVCDCNSRWLKNWLITNRHRVKDINDIICASGKGQGRAVIEVPEADFICEAWLSGTYRTLAISLGVILTGFLVIFLVIYRFREEIKILLYFHFKWHPFDRSDENIHDKVYDVFISYCSKDYKWPCHILRRKLENSDPSFKLCLSDRDFAVGAPIEENIFDSINKSRRMIMLLSRKYLQSDWCIMEFRAAHRKVLNEQSRYLILILYDDISENELDDDIKLYIKTNTYLSIHDKLFWERLLYALPEQPLSVLRPSPASKGLNRQQCSGSPNVSESSRSSMEDINHRLMLEHHFLTSQLEQVNSAFADVATSSDDPSYLSHEPMMQRNSQL